MASTDCFRQTHLGPLVILVLWLAGCVPYQQLARQQDLQQQLLPGERFLHRIFTNTAARCATPASRWHVYIEGDGHAVTPQGRPAADPTPRSPLLLPMMARDPAPALYLGRPCYFDTADPQCHPGQWTLARYSEDTVASMAAVLRQQLPASSPVTLIGHSGGGTLAVLLAPRLPQVDRVVTLAGNLAVARWTTYHDYTPLDRSLDPSQAPPLPPSIAQYHLAATADREILPQWIQAYAATQPRAHFVPVPETRHDRGWRPWWTLISSEPIIKASGCDKVTR